MTDASQADLSDIYHFEELADWLGTSGQPTAEQFHSIASAGYRSVVNLALAGSDNSIAEEGSIVAGLGMTYVHLPVKFEAPGIDDLRAFFGVMDALSVNKVWVHCVVNARVSVFVYHYLRMRKGVGEDAARSRLLDRWEPEMNDVWRDFLALTGEEVAG